MTNDYRTSHLTVALSAKEVEQIKRTAKDNDLSVSAFIREVLIGFS